LNLKTASPPGGWSAPRPALARTLKSDTQQCKLFFYFVEIIRFDSKKTQVLFVRQVDLSFVFIGQFFDFVHHSL
jgi:hypothetical protein